MSDEKKSVGSTAGMQATVTTSQLYTERAKCVQNNVKDIKEAITNKDFSRLAELTMKVWFFLSCILHFTVPHLRLKDFPTLINLTSPFPF